LVHEVEAVSGKLGRAEVFDAEVVALAVALDVAAAERRALVLSDSQAAVCPVSKGFSPSCQPAAERAFNGLRHPGVKLDWCPAHAGVKGNERADQLAKLATGPEVEPRGLPTHAYAKAAARKRHEQRVREWWEKSKPARYGTLGLGPHPDALNTTRPRMGRIVQHRTGHGPFVSYLRRFKEGTPRHSCGVPQEPQHLSYCQELAAHRTAVREACRAGKRKETVLGTKELYGAMVGRQALRFFPK